jgi:hypothetical protein
MGPSITGVMGSMAGSSHYDESLSHTGTGLHNTPHAGSMPHANWAPVNEDLLMAMTAVRVARKSLSVEAVRRVSMSLDNYQAGAGGVGRNSGYGMTVRRRSAVWDTVVSSCCTNASFERLSTTVPGISYQQRCLVILFSTQAPPHLSNAGSSPSALIAGMHAPSIVTIK